MKLLFMDFEVVKLIEVCETLIVFFLLKLKCMPNGFPFLKGQKKRKEWEITLQNKYRRIK